MEEKPILIDKNLSNMLSTKINMIETKNPKEIPKSSLAYDFCKSLEELNVKNYSCWNKALQNTILLVFQNIL